MKTKYIDIKKKTNIVVFRWGKELGRDRRNFKGALGKLRPDGFLYYLESDDFTRVYIFKNLSNNTL